MVIMDIPRMLVTGLGVASLLIASCTTTTPTYTQPMAQVMSAPQHCDTLGQLTGIAGNFFTGELISNAKLESDSLKDAQMQAAKRGADTFLIVSVEHRSTAVSLGTTSVVTSIAAFNCGR